MAPLFQARQIPRIVPPLPPVKGLPADTEIPAGQCRIAVSCVMVHPLRSCLCQPADALDPANDFGPRSSRSYYLHDDTIEVIESKVSLIIMNESTPAPGSTLRVNPKGLAFAGWAKGASQSSSDWIERRAVTSASSDADDSTSPVTGRTRGCPRRPKWEMG